MKALGCGRYAAAREAKRLYREHRPMWWSASAAIRHSRRCLRPARTDPDRPPRAECRAWPGQPLARRRKPRRSRPLMTEVERLKPRYGQDSAGRQSGAGRDCQARRAAVPAVRRIRAAEDTRHRRKPGRDGAWAKWCRQGLGLLEASLRRRLQVVQQCRPEDIEARAPQYAELGIPAELMTYIEDMAEQTRATRTSSSDAPGPRRLPS